MKGGKMQTNKSSLKNTKNIPFRLTASLLPFFLSFILAGIDVLTMCEIDLLIA
jgi:hypothetical protein